MIFSPSYLITVPIIVAFLTPLLGKKILKYLATIVMAFEVLVSTYLYLKSVDGTVVEYLGNRQAPIGIALAVDHFNAMFMVLFTAIGFLASLYLLFRKDMKTGFVMLFMISIAASIGVVITSDMFNMFVFLEIVSVSTYALVSADGKKHDFAASLRYLIMGSVSSTFILFGIAIIYAFTGTLNMAHITQNLNLIPERTAAIAFGFFLVGLAIEAELFPLNAWVPDAYESSPTPVVIVLSGIVSKMGIYAMARIMFTVLGNSGYAWYGNALNLLMVISVITIIVGELVALRQINIKRVLAYSSVAQAGMIMFAFSINDSRAFTAAMFLVFAHSIAKTMMFTSSDTFHKSMGSFNIPDLKGIGRKMPIASLGFTLGVFTLIGIPFLPGFWGKLYMLISLLPNGSNLLTDSSLIKLGLISLILLASMAEVLYYFRVLNVMYNIKDISLKAVPRETIAVCIFITVVGIGALLLLGIYPESVLNVFRDGGNALVNTSGYIAKVLGGA